MQQSHDFGATLQFGVVAAVDDAKHSVRVTLPALENLQTDWLPVVSLAAGGNQFYALPDPGELAVCLLDARGEGGVCLGVIYNAADAAPAASRNVWMKRFSNGTVIQHDRSSGQVVVDTPGEVLVTAAQQVKVATPYTEITGNTTVLGHLTYSSGLTATNGGGGDAAKINGIVRVENGDIILNGVSLYQFITSHTHIDSIGGSTSVPKY